MFWIAKTIANLFGLDISKVQRWVAIGIVLLVLGIVIFLGLWLKSCFTKEPSMNEEEIQAAQNAMRDGEYEKAREILANVDVKEKVIAGEVSTAAANTEAVKQEAKKKYDQMTPEELQAEFNKKQ